MSFLTKKHLPRRTFLRGAGVTVALPLLDAMLPAATALAQTAARPIKRFVGVWHPHGASPGYWSPVEEGRDFTFSFITEPLAPFRDRTVLVSGLDSSAAISTPEEPGGNHARGAVFLSGARPRRDAVTPHLGVTIDQLIAQKHGRDTLLSSLELGIEDSSHNGGNCNWGYSCAYTNSVSDHRKRRNRTPPHPRLRRCTRHVSRKTCRFHTRSRSHSCDRTSTALCRFPAAT
jgi:hypothetical protein